MKTALIICTWNRADSLRKTLDAVARLRPPTNAELHVLVVDNNSSDTTAAALRRYQSQWTGNGPFHCLFEKRKSKAPRPTQSWRQRVFSRSERIRSQLLLELKRPEGRWPGKLVRLIATGLLSPTVELLNHHAPAEMLAHWLATLRVLSELGRVHRHATLCKCTGAHFLAPSV